MRNRYWAILSIIAENGKDSRSRGGLCWEQTADIIQIYGWKFRADSLGVWQGMSSSGSLVFTPNLIYIYTGFIDRDSD